MQRQRRDWEDLAAEDLYWSILSTPGRRFTSIEAETFFASGEAEVDGVLQRAATFGLPQQLETALDFGCGAGRLTRALARHAQQVVGVDISDQMIAEARQLNADCDRCRFEVNTADDLHAFADMEFDLVYTSIV